MSGRIAARMSASRNVPSGWFGTGRGVMPPRAAIPPCSNRKVWLRSPTIASSPRPQCARSEDRFPIVPLATKSAASLPNLRADISSKRLTVGSSPKTSSPNSARAIAWRIAGVGKVTVSLRRSITFTSVPPVTRWADYIEVDCAVNAGDCGRIGPTPAQTSRLWRGTTLARARSLRSVSVHRTCSGRRRGLMARPGCLPCSADGAFVCPAPSTRI